MREKLHDRKKRTHTTHRRIPCIPHTQIYVRLLLGPFGIYSPWVLFDFVICRFNNTKYENERAYRIESLKGSAGSCNSSYVEYIRNVRYADDLAGSGNSISCRQRAVQPRKVYTSAGT